jgi:hypothetical protein
MVTAARIYVEAELLKVADATLQFRDEYGENILLQLKDYWEYVWKRVYKQEGSVDAVLAEAHDQSFEK